MRFHPSLRCLSITFHLFLSSHKKRQNLLGTLLPSFFIPNFNFVIISLRVSFWEFLVLLHGCFSNFMLHPSSFLYISQWCGMRFSYLTLLVRFLSFSPSTSHVTTIRSYYYCLVLVHHKSNPLPLNLSFLLCHVCSFFRHFHVLLKRLVRCFYFKWKLLNYIKTIYTKNTYLECDLWNSLAYPHHCQAERTWIL